MDISFDDFRRTCPASALPDEALFEAIGVFVENAKSQAASIVTLPIYNKFDKEWPTDKDYDIIMQLRVDTVGYICTLAFWNAVPSLDLVLTATGFGVVSNQNVAPASADRVEKLRTSLRRSSLSYLDSMISTLRFLESWSGSAAQLRFFSSLFWHSDQIKPIAGALATRDDLVAKQGEIKTAELKVAELISPEQLAQLRILESTGKATSIQSMAISFCRAYVIALLCDPNSLELHRRTLLGFVEAHPDEFKLYHTSQTYKANHFEPYRNEKDDSCFFFG